MIVAWSIGAVILSIALYLIHVNNAFNRVPEEVQKLSAPEWTKAEINKTYEEVCTKPIDFDAHLPPKLERRYVVVGGSGLVGGFMVLHLLGRGQPPESIRIIDFRKPSRGDLNEGEAARVDYAQADITSIDSITAAFQKPWASHVTSLPLTVFHTAAAIRPQERTKLLLHRVYNVNVKGTENVVSAAKTAGADIFIFTSSASVSLRPVNYWLPPWRSTIKNFLQIFKDPDNDQNIRPHEDYFGNYPLTKAHGEDIVMRANEESFRTGAIRPACVVYGSSGDLSIGLIMKRGSVETWLEHMSMNYVHACNISLAHLLYERALARPPASLSIAQIGGRSYNIADPNLPPTFGSIYRLLTTLTSCAHVHIPFVPMLILAHAIEAWSLLLARFPSFAHTFGLKEVPGFLNLVQPSTMMSGGVYQYAFSTQAEKRVEDGGLGYRGLCTTLEGMCMQVKAFNAEGGRKGRKTEGVALGIPAKK